MSGRNNPEWVLSDEWAVSRDPYNWILMRKTGKSWKKSYYASPEQMLKALFQKLTCTEPAKPDLLEHLQACLDVAQAFSGRFYQQVGIKSASDKIPALKHASKTVER